MGFCEILAFLYQTIRRHTPHDHNRDTFLPLIPLYALPIMILFNLVVKSSMTLYRSHGRKSCGRSPQYLRRVVTVPSPATPLHFPPDVPKFCSYVCR